VFPYKQVRVVSKSHDDLHVDHYYLTLATLNAAASAQ